METVKIIGVDLGGTNVQTARLNGTKIEQSYLQNISALESQETVLAEIISSIKQVMDSEVSGIGIGIPGLVELDTGIVYELNNIPSWKKVPLREILEGEFDVPVSINNDANCFALGESYFGQGKNYNDMVGIIVGTGLGSGIIFEKKLYNGANCGSGEFGMLPYLDHNYEYYCSGQFFKNHYNESGKEMALRAEQGNSEALDAFNKFGFHLGKAVMAIAYTLDSQLIVLGGSVSKSFPYFKKTMWESLSKIKYQQVLKNLKIDVNINVHIPVLGAAALAIESQKHTYVNIKENSELVVDF